MQFIIQITKDETVQTKSHKIWQGKKRNNITVEKKNHVRYSILFGDGTCLTKKEKNSVVCDLK